MGSIPKIGIRIGYTNQSSSRNNNNSNNGETVVVALANENIHPAMKTPGLLTATFHRSTDGTRVINYGQWENEEAIENLKKQPGFGSGKPYWDGVAENEHHLYQLIVSCEAN